MKYICHVAFLATGQSGQRKEVKMAGKIFESHNMDLEFILKEIRVGRIGLPDLQRPFVWSNEKVKNLYDSMLNGFPVGYIML